ncbi:MAG TPA: PKD domain-containing protein [Desulfobacteria bacterium]|nr:PKD domain-containing protein [Desulfobacteria bacterium]
MNTKHGLLLLGIGFLLICMFVGTASAKTWYVDDSGGADFTKIQDAINAANESDTIFVYSGTYIEHLSLDKNNLTLLGEDRNTTIIDGYGYAGDVVTVGGLGGDSCAINCTINGFTIENSGVSDAAIATECSKCINISNNVLKNSYNGVSSPDYWCGCNGYELRAGHNIITQNIISDNNGAGISARSSDNIISHNVIFNNEPGVSISNDNNTISDNNISYNGGRSNIALSGSKNNIIANNTIKDGGGGIEITGSCYYNTIINNTIVSTYEVGGIPIASLGGIYIRSSNHNYVIANTLNKTYGAIRLNQANYNRICDNNISNNYRGIEIKESHDNLVYHNNLINNTGQAIDDGSNKWDNGSIEGGNYWSDHNCTGNPSNGSEPYYIEDAWPTPTPPTAAPTVPPTAAPTAAPTPESEHYYSEGGVIDHYPFEKPNGWLKAENQPPIAIIDSITPNPAKQGKDTVSFIGHGTDFDGSVVAYNWSSSNDGVLNTSSSFTKPASDLSVGTHTIYFKVQDDDGTWSSAATEILMIEAANQPPVALFSYLPVNPAINETVTFNASASYDSDGTLVSYNWSFGDEDVTNTTDLSVTHSYSSIGNYTVNLTVTDDEGATNTTSRALQVCLKPPIATFSCSPPNPVVNETVTFNASESYDPNGVIITYEFEFGDGTNGTGEVVTHSYSSVGMYTVNLTLTDDEGAMNRTSQTIKVFSNISYFDTEPGTYPSISGTHTGTITMTHTVNVSRIYLYPSTGTGGHLEYAKIWNTSWSGAEAHWNGYVGDWHNCSFDTNFTLIAGETYNYTIRTGSYPQIHHQPELLTAKGWITCTSFVDANGKTYTDWIPAIRLE